MSCGGNYYVIEGPRGKRGHNGPIGPTGPVGSGELLISRNIIPYSGAGTITLFKDVNIEAYYTIGLSDFISQTNINPIRKNIILSTNDIGFRVPRNGTLSQLTFELKPTLDQPVPINSFIVKVQMYISPNPGNDDINPVVVTTPVPTIMISKCGPFLGPFLQVNNIFANENSIDIIHINKGEIIYLVLYMNINTGATGIFDFNMHAGITFES